MRAAVLMTCFNRKEQTVGCLDSVRSQTGTDQVSLDIFLVDDGSTDGTGDVISSAYPQVNVIQGDGSLYWNGGMNLAWKTASRSGYDFYIWINDDVALANDAFSTLFDACQRGLEQAGQPPVIVGCFREEGSEQHAYGGFSAVKTFMGMRSKRILPQGEIRRCDTFNGNLVLVPKDVFDKVGYLDERYTHSFGDKDYGYRCSALGIPMYITPGYVGECSRNSTTGTWVDPKLPLSERYKKLLQPTGIPPSEYYYSFRKNSNHFAAMIAVLKLYLRLLVPGVWTSVSRSRSGE